MVNESRTQPIDVAFLRQKLENAGVPLELWGMGEAKTLDHLLREFQSGDSDLIDGPDGHLLRVVRVAAVRIFHTDQSGLRLHLTEKEQVFADGRRRQRHFDDDRSLSEKISTGELPQDVAAMGVLTELGLAVEVTGEPEIQTVLLDGRSYPGLLSRYETYLFEVELTNEQYRAEGYREVQPDKTTIFVWERI